jgi:hypothetical protein
MFCSAAHSMCASFCCCQFDALHQPVHVLLLLPVLMPEMNKNMFVLIQLVTTKTHRPVKSKQKPESFYFFFV